MAMYGNLQTLQVVTLAQLRLLFPGVGIPNDVESPQIISLGWVVVDNDPRPSTNDFQYVVNGPVRREGDRVIQGWNVVYVTTEESGMIIDAERDRRMQLGVTFNGVQFQTRDQDRQNLSEASQLAFMAVVNGAAPGNLRWADPATDFAWIATDNSLVTMDAQTVLAFQRAASGQKNTLIFAGRALKQLSTPPGNYADDSWWAQ